MPSYVEPSQYSFLNTLNLLWHALPWDLKFQYGLLLVLPCIVGIFALFVIIKVRPGNRTTLVAGVQALMFFIAVLGVSTLFILSPYSDASTWHSVVKHPTAAALDKYLEHHPDGYFGADARQCLLPLRGVTISVSEHYESADINFLIRERLERMLVLSGITDSHIAIEIHGQPIQSSYALVGGSATTNYYTGAKIRGTISISSKNKSYVPIKKEYDFIESPPQNLINKDFFGYGKTPSEAPYPLLFRDKVFPFFLQSAKEAWGSSSMLSMLMVRERFLGDKPDIAKFLTDLGPSIAPDLLHLQLPQSDPNLASDFEKIIISALALMGNSISDLALSSLDDGNPRTIQRAAQVLGLTGDNRGLDTLKKLEREATDKNVSSSIKKALELLGDGRARENSLGYWRKQDSDHTWNYASEDHYMRPLIRNGACQQL